MAVYVFNKVFIQMGEKTENCCHLEKKRLNLIYFLSWDYHYYSICSYCSRVMFQVNCLFVHLFAWFRTHHWQAKRATADEGVYLPNQ